MLGTAIEQQTLPAVVDDQIGGIALDAVAGANLEDLAVRHANHRKDVEQHAVFAVLRMTTELDIRQIWSADAAAG